MSRPNSTVRLVLVAVALFSILNVCAQRCVACKYSVRDVAFVDLRPSLYRLEILPVAGASGAHIESLEKFALGATVDANIEVDIRPTSTEAAASDTRTAGWPVTGSARLADAEGRTLTLVENANTETLRAAIVASVDSPMRSKLLRDVFERHSFILVVEGDDARANEQAWRVATGAAEDIGGTLDELPKPIKSAPLAVRLPLSDRSAEQVLLWSLGIAADDAATTYIVVLQGRLQRLGPVMEAPGVSRTELAATLSIIGQDCECDLDRSWMDGPVPPHVWNSDSEQSAVAALGFDPGDALVKAEMRRILARGRRNLKENVDSPSLLDDPLLTYREVVLEPTPMTPPEQADAVLEASEPVEQLAARTAVDVEASEDMASPPPRPVDKPIAAHNDPAWDEQPDTSGKLGWTILFTLAAVASVAGIASALLLVGRPGERR